MIRIFIKGYSCFKNSVINIFYFDNIHNACNETVNQIINPVDKKLIIAMILNKIIVITV